jgi:tRNA-dihydrouridine synthase C
MRACSMPCPEISCPVFFSPRWKASPTDDARGVLTSLGGYDWGICEFIRVTNVLPVRPSCASARNCSMAAGLRPARRCACNCSAPIRTSWPKMPAAVSMNPAGVDLNFGCPAPTVNRHRGGSACSASRNCCTKSSAPCAPWCRLHIPVYRQDAPRHRRHQPGGRLRPGAGRRRHRRTDRAWPDQARRLPPAGPLGVDRQGAGGGRYPDHRQRRGVDRGRLRNCQQETGCDDIMLGRGAIADPLLARRVRGEEGGGWAELMPGVATYWLGAYGARWWRCMPAGASSNGWPCCAAIIPRPKCSTSEVRPIKAAHDIDAALIAEGILSPLQLAA